MTAIGSTEFSDEIENFVKHVMQRYETEKITEFA
jgi:beta-xylosidase